ncbi:MAG: hypothetical protein R2710_15320 [Acidimicrobiales bacterium]
MRRILDLARAHGELDRLGGQQLGEIFFEARDLELAEPEVDARQRRIDGVECVTEPFGEF